MRLWRIASALYPVWSAEGARLRGGRWNLRGTPAIYAATSYAAAMLEIMVHANLSHVPMNFRYVTIDVPDDAPIERVNEGEVPGWRETPPRASSAAGDAWLTRRSGLVLLVPSVVTDGLDLNALLNPAHADFARIVVSEEQPVRWDARLLPGYSAA